MFCVPEYTISSDRAFKLGLPGWYTQYICFSSSVKGTYSLKGNCSCECVCSLCLTRENILYLSQLSPWDGQQSTWCFLVSSLTRFQVKMYDHSQRGKSTTLKPLFHFMLPSNLSFIPCVLYPFPLPLAFLYIMVKSLSMNFSHFSRIIYNSHYSDADPLTKAVLVLAFPFTLSHSLSLSHCVSNALILPSERWLKFVYMSFNG